MPLRDPLPPLAHQGDVARDSLDDCVAQVVDLLEAVASQPDALDAIDPVTRDRLLVVAGQVARPDSQARRRQVRTARRKDRQALRTHNERTLDQTGIRQRRREPLYPTPLPALAGNAAAEPSRAPAGTLCTARKCYVCKAEFRTVHFFYDSMCPPCAELNFCKRNQTADLSGQVAVVTGARVKIGYQTAIKLLRAGARVVALTRFPRDAAARYASEIDAAAWRDRLTIHGIDLRHTPSVEVLASYLAQSLDRLDILIHNACQTVRRPPGFYAHLMAGESGSLARLPAAQRDLIDAYEAFRAGPGDALAPAGQRAGIDHAAALSQLLLLRDDLERSEALFPTGRYDADAQQVDLRAINSWRLRLSDVPSVELLEVHLTNAIAPFVLTARLEPLLFAGPARARHVVNVSAMEGQFARPFKTDRHPHTNMAKAALDRMTRTCAATYAERGVHMNSVDTGWVTDEDPDWLARRKTAEHGFHPPLDIVDGAARICDPIFSGFSTGRHPWGKFFKDYCVIDW